MRRGSGSSSPQLDGGDREELDGDCAHRCVNDRGCMEVSGSWQPQIRVLLGAAAAAAGILSAVSLQLSSGLLFVFMPAVSQPATSCTAGTPGYLKSACELQVSAGKPLQ